MGRRGGVACWATTLESGTRTESRSNRRKSFTKSPQSESGGQKMERFSLACSLSCKDGRSDEITRKNERWRYEYGSARPAGKASPAAQAKQAARVVRKYD